MSSDNNHGGELVMGGALAAVIIGALAVRAIGQFFTELAITFDAFGKFTGSFILMFWNIFQVVGLTSLIFASAFCAVYFSIKYFKLVKASIELHAQIEDFMRGHEVRANIRCDGIERDLNYKVRCLADKLEKALKKTEIAPESVKQVSHDSLPQPVVAVPTTTPDTHGEESVQSAQPF